jgi:hypothetical protein
MAAENEQITENDSCPAIDFIDNKPLIVHSKLVS